MALRPAKQSSYQQIHQQQPSTTKPKNNSAERSPIWECGSLLPPSQGEACLAALTTGAVTTARALNATPLRIGNTPRKLSTAHAPIHLPLSP
jgi:hypothetical protein